MTCDAVLQEKLLLKLKKIIDDTKQGYVQQYYARVLVRWIKAEGVLKKPREELD